jgi:hypothetical protein
MNVIFMRKGGGVFGWLIRLWTRSSYCHCELEFSDGMRYSAYVDKGTQFDMPLPEHTVAKQWTRVPVPMSAEQEKSARTFCRSEIDCRYDRCGILLTHVFPFRTQSKSKWFSSEVCAAALKDAGVLGGTVRPSRISPKRLYRLLALAHG